MCSFFSLLGDPPEGDVEELEADEVGDIWVIADIAPRLEDIPLIFEGIPLRFMLWCMLDILCMLCMFCIAMDMLGTPVNMLLPESTVILIGNHLKVQLNRNT